MGNKQINRKHADNRMRATSGIKRKVWGMLAASLSEQWARALRASVGQERETGQLQKLRGGSWGGISKLTSREGFREIIRAFRIMAGHNHKDPEKTMNTIFIRGKNTPLSGSGGKFIKSIQGTIKGLGLGTGDGTLATRNRKGMGELSQRAGTVG